MPSLKAEIPPIVRPVLAQIARMRTSGEMDEPSFRAQIERVATRELHQRGYSLITRELTNGQIRFLIKTSREGIVCDTMDCGCSDKAEAC